MLGLTLQAFAAARQDGGAAEERVLRSSLEAVRAASDACDWQGAARAAEAMRGMAPRGGGWWIEASAYLVRARYELWQPEELERVARELLAELVDARRVPPEEEHSALGGLHPNTAGHVLWAQVLLARVLDGRGWQHEALGHLLLALRDLERGAVTDALALRETASVDAAWILHRLGRAAEAYELLAAVRDGASGSRTAAMASALLQNGLPDAREYRGRYAGDAAQARRIERLRAALPAARARLAQRLDLPLEHLPRMPVGVVDTPRDEHGGQLELGTFAVTESDARRPHVPPVVIVFSEGLAFEMVEPELMLMHELSHAVLISRLGLAYEALPPWLSEAISQGLTGELEPLVDEVLGVWERSNRAGLLAADFWEREPLALESSACDELPPIAGPLVGLYMEEVAGHAGLLRFLAELEAGGTVDDALRAVYGAGLAELPDAARPSVRARLEARRQELLAPLRALREAASAGPRALLERADELLSTALPLVARTSALRARAEALEVLGRPLEAAEAWAEVDRQRGRDVILAERARAGRARCTLAAGQVAEARALLERLERDAFTRTTREWAGAQLAELERGS